MARKRKKIKARVPRPDCVDCGEERPAVRALGTRLREDGTLPCRDTTWVIAESMTRCGPCDRVAGTGRVIYMLPLDVDAAAFNFGGRARSPKGFIKDPLIVAEALRAELRRVEAVLPAIDRLSFDSFAMALSPPVSSTRTQPGPRGRV